MMHWNAARGRWLQFRERERARGALNCTEMLEERETAKCTGMWAKAKGEGTRCTGMRGEGESIRCTD